MSDRDPSMADLDADLRRRERPRVVDPHEATVEEHAAVIEGRAVYGKPENPKKENTE